MSKEYRNYGKRIDKLIDGFTEKCAINPMKENF